jgi:hypothetical protein
VVTSSRQVNNVRTSLFCTVLQNQPKNRSVNGKSLKMQTSTIGGEHLL